MVVYSNYEDRTSNDKVKTFDSVNKFLPAFLLIISVLLFRCRLNGKQSENVIPNEKVIVVHVALFLSFILIYVTHLILSSYYYSSAVGSMKECRFYVSENYFYCFYIAVNIATLILFIYMSVAFSRPLNGYWREFLLSYREQSLNQAISARMPPSEQERARRYHEAAVRDSNRQILIMQALLDTTQENSTSNVSDILTDLNTEEAEILNDGVDSETSEELFARVRREDANLNWSSKPFSLE